MKRTVTITLLALLLLFAGCHTRTTTQPDAQTSDGEHAAESVGSVFQYNDCTFWSLSETMGATYMESTHTYIYVIDGKTCYLTATKSKKDANTIPENALEHLDVDGRVICAVEQKDKFSNGSSISYVCYDGSFCYAIGNRDVFLDIRECLSLQEAYALLEAPAAPDKDITLIAEEWSFYSMLPTAIINCSITCNDGGKAYDNLDAAEERTENGVSFRVTSDGETLAYTDGTHSLVINELCLDGAEHAYLTTQTAQMLMESVRNE